MSKEDATVGKVRHSGILQSEKSSLTLGKKHRGSLVGGLYALCNYSR